MIDNANVRGWLYVLQIAAAVAAVVLAVGVVFFGWATQEDILLVCTVAAGLYVGFTGLLARLNLTPPDC